jgi:hypothetical protein
MKVWHKPEDKLPKFGDHIAYVRKARPYEWPAFTLYEKGNKTWLVENAICWMYIAPEFSKIAIDYMKDKQLFPKVNIN